MAGKKILLLVTFIVLTVNGCESCNSETKEIHLHITDCEELENQIKGPWIVASGKQRRFIEQRDTCGMTSAELLTRMHDNAVDEMAPHKVAGAFIYRYFTAKNAVFWGPQKTFEAVKGKRTLNIVLDKSASFVVLTMQSHNSTGDTMMKIVSSQQVIDQNVVPSGMEITKCVNLIEYIRKETERYGWTVTLTDFRNSNPEYRFLNVTESGIGGFYTTKNLIG